MRKERIETITDFFIDDNGDKHWFVIAALSVVLPTNLSEITNDPDDEGCELTYEVAECTDWDVETVDYVVKGLKLGYSICNTNDNFDEELGKTIAIGRARKNKEFALYATKPGYINTRMVKAFLEQEAAFFKDNPETRIAAYRRK